MNVSEFRRSLREELARSAPAAVEMLQGRRPLDPLVVLSAAKVAGLFGPEGDPASRPHVSLLRDAAEAPSFLQALALVDPTHPDLDDDGPDAPVFWALAIGGAVAFSRRVAEAPAASLLTRAEASAALAPPLPAALHPLADAVCDALDLDADHPASMLLLLLRSDLPADPTGAFDRGVEQAFARVFPDVGDAVGRALAAPKAPRTRSPAAPEQVAAYAAEEGSELEVRTPLAALPEMEVNLVLQGGFVFLEWFGDGAPPVRAHIEGAGGLLPEQPPFVAGSRLWLLNAPAPGATVHLTWEDSAVRSITLP